MFINLRFLFPRLRELLALSSGACGTLAFSPYDLWPAAIVSLSGLLAINLKCNVRQAGWYGFLWGVGLFGTGVNWIHISITQLSGSFPLHIILMIILTAYLALYPLLFSILLVIFWPHTSIWRLAFGTPVLWSITEYLRAWIFTGFPWLEFGYSQIDGPLRGIAPLFGVQAITFILLLVSGLFVYTFTKQNFLPALIAVAILVLLYPLCLLRWYKSQPNRTINVTLVQGNISQVAKGQVNQIKPMLDIYLKYTLPAIGNAQIVIWPESAIPDNELTHHTLLMELDKQLRAGNTRLITGIIEASPTTNGYNYYNSIIVLGESTPYFLSSKNRYKKHHLVPFGETVFLKRIIQSLLRTCNLQMLSFSKGRYLQDQLLVSDMKITATICYEIILGTQVRDNFRSDTDFLLTVSNDGWFGDSIGPWQHFQMARMRSLELGRPLLRSTNNGITALVNADGKPVAQLPQFTRNVLNIRITPTKGITPYAYLGSWPLWTVVFLIGYIALFFSRQDILNKSYIKKIDNK
ncbi:apolipoprotein N-acyltransferase [secondary endosymbiont of Heteropsylla cubana]|uniref:Apolipoprotein N-acyltransferase n=1 Tax=secondary endosymbiont of Heteropsylla cubana TaxID=134287 RepID=J3Z5M7_9ENTR|nr:apolipoprotein N-acyltransferase [secondary endosymbiont of Heteropsylla cubana]AFP85644.1 apolipoprotein N-acyltransferase [secondary endosymbiont of Heteropsylla cubana]